MGSQLGQVREAARIAPTARQDATGTPGGGRTLVSAMRRVAGQTSEFVTTVASALPASTAIVLCDRDGACPQHGVSSYDARVMDAFLNNL